MKVLVLGATGMLGNAMFRTFNESSSLDVTGTVRSEDSKRHFAPDLVDRLVSVNDLLELTQLTRLLEDQRPEVVVNCTSARSEPKGEVLRAFVIYSMLPQQLAQLCRARGIRFIQFSSDGVFSGTRGGYTEDDIPDARDVYGVAKALGEIRDSTAVTLRTSMIGHELRGKMGLLEWFLSQTDTCKCYTRAIFSGLPTVVLAEIVRDIILPRPHVTGIFHLAAPPISKFDLLSLVAKEYGHPLRIVADDTVEIDRSLIAERFRLATGYTAPEWPELLQKMRTYKFGLAGK